MRSLKPIGVLGQPSASAIGRGMAITSGVRMKGRGLVGATGGCPLGARALLITAPHAEAAGVQITGCGASVSAVVHPCSRNCSPAPELTLATRTNEHLPLTFDCFDLLKSPASLVSRSNFSGEDATSTTVHPLGALAVPFEDLLLDGTHAPANTASANAAAAPPAIRFLSRERRIAPFTRH